MKIIKGRIFSFLRKPDNINDTGSYILLSKQRSGSPTGATVVQDDDLVGQISFTAGDGTDLTSRIAEIKGIVDGTPGSNDTPGRLSFWTTADGANGVFVAEEILAKHDESYLPKEVIDILKQDGLYVEPEK